ncbi:hypothetical protein C2E20_1197 [Micractinium conductrix]|uniref:Uncharacterized protein n=1 Tax=Micractinium conductrix TaxID=554055 RepID=A0A2P6VMG7_9CHLO|nr:hypothetical protein C2E20_1197 [Micractinium conductrix]|eukprot:PSC75288.1 hypothetical protein C2E20_1197 [Micractinium conductrix]
MQLQQAACDAGTAAAGLTDDLLASFSALLYFPPANLTPANLASMEAQLCDWLRARKLRPAAQLMKAVLRRADAA